MSAATTSLTLSPSVWVSPRYNLQNSPNTMSAPPVPPRPPTTQPITGYPRAPGAPPPLPPLPPNFRPDIDGHRESPPRFADPMLAPRPQKLLSSVPADVSTSHKSPSGLFLWHCLGLSGIPSSPEIAVLVKREAGSRYRAFARRELERCPRHQSRSEFWPRLSSHQPFQLAVNDERATRIDRFCIAPLF